MRVFRVSYFLHSDSSQGCEYFSSMTKAFEALDAFEEENGDNCDKDRSTIDKFDFNPTKKSILSLLNAIATYPDNG